jgi:hypothetical protein
MQREKRYNLQREQFICIVYFCFEKKQNFVPSTLSVATKSFFYTKDEYFLSFSIM